MDFGSLKHNLDQKVTSLPFLPARLTGVVAVPHPAHYTPLDGSLSYYQNDVSRLHSNVHLVTSK